MAQHFAELTFKQTLKWMLKLAVAVVGIAYIAGSLTWTDRVVLPAGTVLADGSVLQQSAEAKVLDGSFEGGSAGPLTLHLLVEAGSEETRVTALPADRLDAGEGSPHFVPGIVTMLRGADLRLLALGAGLMGLILPIQAVRWLLLMRCRGLDPGFARTFRLTLAGLFFNFCMPGMTGGDLLKAYYAARGSGRRGAAVMSVVFDRVTGMLGLVLLAAVAGLGVLGRPAAAALTLGVWVAMAATLTLGAAYFSRRLRRRLGGRRALAWLPFQSALVRVDEAAMAYRGHGFALTGAVVLSLPAHLAQMLATGYAGHALGMDLSMALLVAVLPVVFIAGCLPITYQGLGVMEAVALALLLDPPAAHANQIVGMLLVARLFLVAYALVGAFTLLRGDIGLFPPQTEADDADAPLPDPAAAGA